MAVRISSDASALKRSASTPASTAFTLAGWFYFSSIPARFYGPLGIYAGTDGVPTSGLSFHQISSAASGSAQLVLGSGAGSAVNLVSLRAGFWYFLAMTGSGTAAGAVNGYSRAQYENAFSKAVNATTFASFTAARIEFGRDSFAGDFIDGAAQHCVAFDRVLDEAELMKLSYSLLREKKFPDPRNLNVYYRLRGANDVQDLSGNARPLTATVGADAAGYKIVTPRRRGGPAPAGSDVTVALTGVAGTGQVGTVVPSRTVPLTGAAGTGAAGTVAPVITIPLTGNAGTGQVGTVIPNSTVALTGVAGPGAAGTAAPGTTLALTGNLATGQVGNVTPSLSVALTGVAGTGAAGTLAPSTTIGLTGVSGTGQVGNVSTSGDLTLAITGVAATGAVGTLTPATSVPVTGNAATAAVGNVTPALSLAATGVAATGASGALAPSTTVALTGTPGTGQVGNVTVASSDVTIALTGVGATGQVGTLVPSGMDVASTASSPAGGSSSFERPQTHQQKRRAEKKLEDDIRRIYRRLTNAEPEIAAAIVEPVTSPPAKKSSKAAEVEHRAAQITLSRIGVDAEIALRLAEKELETKRAQRAENLRRIALILQLVV